MRTRLMASRRLNIFRLPGQTRQSPRPESNHHLWCLLLEQGHISQTTSPHPLHLTGQDWGSHANLDQTGKENPSYWFRSSWLALRKGWGLLFPESQGRHLYQIPSLWVKKGGLNVKFVASVSERKTAFFLKVMVVGSGEEEGIQSKGTTKVTVRSNLLFIYPLPFTIYIHIWYFYFIHISIAFYHSSLHSWPFPPFLPPSLPPTFSPSFLPPFHFPSIEHKPTKVYNLFSIILSSRITVLSKTHGSFLHFVWPWVFVSLQLTPRPLFLHEAFYEHCNPQRSLSSMQSFHHPWGCLPIQSEPIVRKWEDVPWEILDIKSILELDSVCLFPSPTT